ncbi:MAG TPA: competence/damage-inducible protein A [Candidatus Polarisedimenticolaceae bacterium]|nr:competence/damage-inducible protein A [Candidatus Polarisedimenticolaceae bacterium]
MALAAELIAVGSELLRFGRRDGNGDWLQERLAEAGVEVLARALVDDDAGRIASQVEAASRRAGLVVLTGGLGPTEDDRTREALAAWWGRPLQRDPELLRELGERFARFGRTPSPAQERQADLPEGAVSLPNPVGSAPGLLLSRGEVEVVALPGVPAEMRAMAEAHVFPLARRRAAGAALRTRVLHVSGRMESEVDAAVVDLYEGEGTVLTILAGAGEVHLGLRAEGSDAGMAESRLMSLDASLRARLQHDVYGADQDTLASVTGASLARAGQTLAVAESCTAGLLAAAVTAVPGSSAWFRGGVAVYADDLKTTLAGVPEDLLRRHGAVSAPVAEALASGVRTRLGAHWGLGITGIAGPGGGSTDKPVGLVFVALSGPAVEKVRRLHLPGDRELVRRRAVAVALDLLRRALP